MAKKSSSKRSRRWQLLKRFLVIAAAVLVVLGMAGAAAFYVFQGWRARDMASKALESFEQANYRAAWLQVNSARNLRPNDPAVLRASAMIESRFGMPTAMDYWERFAQRGRLSAKDLEERGRAAAALGNDEEFRSAVDALEASGQVSAAGRLRAVRSLARGNMDRAIEEARRAVAATDDPAMKLDLARLLLRRHVDRLSVAPADETSQQIANEMFAIVDRLQDTDQGEEALAFGLTFLLPGQEGQQRWAELAMVNMDAGNPALLPAATVMVDLGLSTPAEVYATLRPVFDAAPLPRRAAMVSWLTRQGMPQEALTLITGQEAGESTEAFLARTEALTKMENWPAVIETADAGGQISQSLRWAVKARAEYALRSEAQSGAKSLAAALRLAAREGMLAAIVAMGDRMGGGETVDVTLVEMCADPAVGDEVFRMTRDRFSRRGPAAQPLLEQAHAKASAAAPNAVSVQDYARYLLLLAASGESDDESATDKWIIDPEETARAMAAAPSDPAVRATHALALLRAGRPEEAISAFEDLTLSFARVPPWQQAVISRTLAEANQMELAENTSQAIDRDKLTKDELLLLQGP